MKEKQVKSKKEKVVMYIIDIVFILFTLFMTYKIYSETGIYTTALAVSIFLRAWFHKSVLKYSYYMMRKITNKDTE